MHTRYFNWLYSLVKGKTSYKDLCLALHSREFIYTMPLDGNRYEDGVDLRYKFGRDHHISDPQISLELDTRPCSVFEMMVALASRCEEDIMYNSEIGGRTNEWFQEMVDSLGLYFMTDDVGVDEVVFNQVIDRFLNREYEPDGKGGLFTLKNCRHDLRTVEIWYQAMWYLTEKEDCSI